MNFLTDSKPVITYIVHVLQILCKQRCDNYLFTINLKKITTTFGIDILMNPICRFLGIILYAVGIRNLFSVILQKVQFQYFPYNSNVVKILWKITYIILTQAYIRKYWVVRFYPLLNKYHISKMYSKMMKITHFLILFWKAKGICSRHPRN